MAASDPRESIRYIVEGGRKLSGAIEPGGNKNAALPIIAAALLTDKTVTLTNVPRIRDTEVLVELVQSVGAEAAWTGRNELVITAKTVRAVDLDPELCAKIRASILLAGPLLARAGHVTLAAARRRRHRPPPRRHALPRLRAIGRDRLRRPQLRTSKPAKLQRRRRLPRRAERHRDRERAHAPPSSPRARPSCATPPPSRTCRISPTSSSRSAPRSTASAPTR